MATRLDVDLTHALDRTLGDGRGLSLAALEEAATRLGDVADWVAGEGERLAFLDLPLDAGPADAAVAWAAAAPEARDLILIGIGGSALSARVFDAIRPAEVAGPRLHVLDTVDPRPVQGLLRTLDPGTTCLIAASKSGATLETLSVFPILEAWLHAARGAEAARRIAVVCGVAASPLRTRAHERGYAVFDIPTAVGGRYSALTPVGLLPAACIGLDPRALLAGAAAARARCVEPRVADNPALALAAAHWAAESSGRGAAVLMPYGEALRPLGPWWAQLVGESLGKPGPSGPAGVTAVAASGPADQHSLLQLLVEGPDDKLTVFVDAAGDAGPDVPADAGDLTYAAGQALGAVLAAERDATEFALAQAGRPSVRVRLAAADAECVGAFLMTYEMAVVLWGRLLGVDPFGQPGVTLGKDAARAVLTGEPADLAARLARHRDTERTSSS